MKQTRLMSLVESVANVIVGYGVAVVTQILIFPIFGLHTTLAQNLKMGAIFTVVSIARSFALRRVFEAIRVDDTIRRLINDGGDESLIARHAFLNAPNLGSAARALVRDGQTTAEEAIRVSRRDSVDAETIADG